MQVAIRNSETERARAEARLERLREGGIAVDEYIDAFVYSYENEQKQEQQRQQQQQQQQAVAAAASNEWPSASDDNNQEEDYTQQQQQYDYSQQQSVDPNAGWDTANTGWGEDANTEQQQEEPAAAEPAADGADWANFGDQQQQ